MRSKGTNRKEFKTGEEKLTSGIKYLVWKKAPNNLLKILPEDIGKRVWIAGTSYSDVWKINHIYSPGEKFWPSGGVEVINKKGETISLFLNEVILHPRQKC